MTLKSLLAAGMTFAALTLFLGPAFAQGASSSQQAAPAASSAPAAGSPSQNWTKVCTQGPDGQPVCAVRQVIVTKNGDFLGALELRIAKGQENTPVLWAAVPLRMLIPPGLALQIDDQDTKHLPFAQCVPQVCYVTLVLNEAYVNNLKKSKKLTVTVRNLKNEAIEIPFNLAGFASVYESDVAVSSSAPGQKASDEGSLQKILADRAEEARKQLEGGDSSSSSSMQPGDGTAPAQ